MLRSMDTLAFKQVDVFTARPFYGNPVAVVIGADALDTAAMQRIAAWTNLSETTFLLPPSSSAADYRLRIFTPRQELPFAGHPTIGSAHAALEAGFVRPRDGRLRQECGAGVLELSVTGEGEARRIFVKAPPARLTTLPPARAEALAQALGAPLAAGQPVTRVDVGVVWIVAAVSDAATLARLEPDAAKLSKLSLDCDAAGATVFARTTGKDAGEAAVHVRSFAPAHGVPEDPVCGSGNVSVGAFLREHRLLGAPAYTAAQGMQVGRDGRVEVRVSPSAIEIGGHAVTCVDGRLRVS